MNLLRPAGTVLLLLAAWILPGTAPAQPPLPAAIPGAAAGVPHAEDVVAGVPPAVEPGVPPGGTPRSSGSASRSLPNGTLPPPPPLPTSPVATFRHLLALAPDARTQTLASRPERQRAVLEARLAEYEALPPAIREERLRATDLYWHLQQLIRRAPSERDTLLAAAPPDLQPVLHRRLAFWDQLPAADRAVLLENEGTLRYLAQTRSSRPPPLPTLNPQRDTAPASVAAAPPVPLRVQAELDYLHRLDTPDLERIQANWRQFFEGSTPRRERALLDMTAQERHEMEQVLHRFQRLSPEQRRFCVGSFTRLASMDPAERSEFLRHAERWGSLDATERAAWRQIVNKLPLLPPLPGPAEPPLPTAPTTTRRVATHGTAP